MTEYPSISSHSRLDEEKIEEETQCDRDADRLRKLGYDAVLGRPLGFWGNMFLSLTCMNPMFDVVVSASVWARDAPAVFVSADAVESADVQVYGYPVTILLHFIMIGPFAEFASAYPVAGAHASWTWRAARAGVRGERQWSWFMNGFVLAGHMGKLLTGLWHAVKGCSSIYISIAGVPTDVTQLHALDPQLWWNPVFQIVLVSVITIILMTRLSRKASFWTVIGIFNIIVVFIFLMLYAVSVTRMPSRRVLNFPDQGKWTKSFSYMMWMAAPTKFIPFDAAAHMSEETRNPAKNVPRSLYVSAAIHFSLVYATVCCFIFGLNDVALGVFYMSDKSNLIPLMFTIGLPISGLQALAVISIAVACSQFLATVVICSRFIFAVARDHGLPFSKYLKMTDRHREPWVANIVLVAIAYLSLISWLYPAMDQTRYYQLTQTISSLMPCVGYFIPFALYLLSNLDLQHEQRTQFTLRKWSKPSALISCLWMLTAVIQGSFPVTNFSTMTTKDVTSTNATTLSYFPWALMGMIAVMTISWFLYGRRHFVGPVRAMTKWTAGVEINPEEANPNSRTDVIRAYLGGSRDKTSHGSAPMTPIKAKSKRSSFQSEKDKTTPLASPHMQPPALTYSQASSEGAQAESQLLPEAAQAESQLLPTKRLSWYQRRESRQPRKRLDGIEEVTGQEMSRSNAQQESGIFPHTQTQTQASFAQQESGIFPEAMSPTQTQFSIAQQESGIFPSQTQTQFSIAQQESGIFPTTSTRFSVAQQESQIMPTQSRFDPEATNLSSAQEESQIFPEESQILSYPPPPSHRPKGYPAPPHRPRK